jgi:hypothetical protein
MRADRLRWRSHWAALLLLGILEGLLFAASFVVYPPPTHGHVLPIQPFLILYFIAQVIVGTALFALVWLLRASSRWWLAAVHGAALVAPVVPFLLEIAGVKRATEAAHEQARLTCAGVEIQSWRVIPRGEPSGPALELRVRSPKLSGPLYVNYVDGKQANGSPATYMDVSRRDARFENPAEAIVVAPLSGVWGPISFLQFALCRSLQDTHSCAFYQYGTDPKPTPNILVHCPQLAPPAGTWPPAADPR